MVIAFADCKVVFAVNMIKGQSSQGKKNQQGRYSLNDGYDESM
jgi:hypothetical protein